ncbi:MULTISPECIES: hypothetical protein [Microcystis]|uniref:Uncharacterized protein n=1 Tax=Microcystis aeruginosa (strain NIES-843 / IAM M-2473) TaxID=449447 RepID=B0JP87_MICAN|nr:MULTISPECIES: hypothetical protein [Microcystis]BAG00398.1 unknown protein [Microcystis aeruginosa NIES-843]
MPDKDLVDLCPPIEPYQVTKSRILLLLTNLVHSIISPPSEANSLTKKMCSPKATRQG